MRSPEQRPCPACEDHRARFAFTVAGFDHLRCSLCGTWFVSPLPSAERIAATYLDPGYHHAVESSAVRMRAEARARVAELARRGCKSVLEIGCGAGFFLEAARDAGIDAVGVDPGPTGELARARGLVVHATWIDAFEPDRRFDAAALWEVVEHLPDPGAALQRVRGWLTPRATLALSTPSASGLPARLLRARFPMVSPPEHLELFSQRGLRVLLERAGFAPSRWRTFSALDGGAIARNLRRFFLGESRPAQWLSEAAGRGAAVPMRLVDRIGWGTSFEIYADAV